MKSKNIVLKNTTSKGPKKGHSGTDFASEPDFVSGPDFASGPYFDHPWFNILRGTIIDV
jgi:hypothetical protein